MPSIALIADCRFVRLERCPVTDSQHRINHPSGVSAQLSIVNLLTSVDIGNKTKLPRP
jgi:hypothetical protein